MTSTTYVRDNGESVEAVNVLRSTFCGGRAEQTILVIENHVEAPRPKWWRTDGYVALGVQHDLAAQGATVEAAREEFRALVEAERALCLSEVQQGDPERPLDHLPPAPEWHRKAAVEHVREVFGPSADVALKQFGLSEEG